MLIFQLLANHQLQLQKHLRKQLALFAAEKQDAKWIQWIHLFAQAGII